MADDKEKTQRQILLQQVESLLDENNVRDLRVLLSDQWESDIAEIVESVRNEKRRLIFSALDHEMAAEVLEKVERG